ncbi:hypothetical protein ACJMK2_026735 [Sinanodonta woodiana]|uniref:Pleckstrin homology-like domain family B member 1 n=1 Tax=Sinanodonta woodiana TaxID=1069815 RepID=A0ABD3XNY2_SINWO
MNFLETGRRKTRQRLSSENLKVTETDHAVKVHSDQPHLVSLGSGRLSTAVTILPLPQGRTTFGTMDSPLPSDVVLQGTGVEAEHCYIDNMDGVITLVPIAKLCSVDGVLIHSANRLAQGSMICLGRSNYFRFNHPLEARKMKDAMPNMRISCSPLQLFQDLENNPEYLKMISEAESSSPRRKSAESSDSLQSPKSLQVTPQNHRDVYEQDEFLNKVCKFELISRAKTSPKSPTYKAASPVNKASPGKISVSSPDYTKSGKRGSGGQIESFGFQGYAGEKLFTKDTATTRVSASILQPSPTSQSPESEISNSSFSSFGSVSIRRKSGSSKTSSGSSRGSNESENSLTEPDVKSACSASWQSGVKIGSSSGAPTQGQGHTSQTTSGEISVKTYGINSTNSNEGLKPETKHIPNGQAVSFAVENCSTEVGNRNTFEGIDFDFNELTESQKDLTLKHREIVAERKKEQEIEKQERQRLDEILNMCAEYERQIEMEITSKKEKIKTPAPQVNAPKGFNMSEVFTVSQEKSPPIPPLPAQYQHLHRDQGPSNGLQVHEQQSQGHEMQSPDQSDSSITQEITEGKQRLVQPPKLLEFSGDRGSTGSLDRKDSRGSMTKIMTNGSLTRLSSPSNPHKDILMNFQMRRCSSNSSNSEEESLCGSSEDTGTIKRRPPSNTSLEKVKTGERPQSPRTSPRSPVPNSKTPSQLQFGNSLKIQEFTNTSPPTKESMVVSKDATVSVAKSSPTYPSEYPLYENIGTVSQIRTVSLSSSKSSDNSHSDTLNIATQSSSKSPLDKTLSESFIGKSFKIEPLRLIVPVLATDSWKTQQSHPTSLKSTDETSAYSSPKYSGNRSMSDPSYELRIKDKNYSGEVPAMDNAYFTKSFLSDDQHLFTLSRLSSSSTESSTHQKLMILEQATENNKEEFMKSPQLYDHWQDVRSSSSSIHSSSTHSSQGLNAISPRSSGSISDTKSSSMENVTPVNSDGEFQGANVHAQDRRSSSGIETSSEGSFNNLDDLEPSEQLQFLRKNKLELLHKIASLKQQILEIETQENEAIRELEMERALLEGEHQMEMEQLSQDQEKINQLKQRQNQLVQKATKQREKELQVIEKEHQKLKILEKEHYETEQLLESCSKEEEDALLERFQKHTEALENQRKLYDDLEFQQLESESKFEEEKEQVQQMLIQDQNILLEKYRNRQDQLHKIDSQRKEMLKSVKANMESLEKKRLQTAEKFKEEKKKLIEVEQKISNLLKSLPSLNNTADSSLEITEDMSDLEIEDKLEAETGRKIQDLLKSPTRKNDTVIKALENVIQNSTSGSTFNYSLVMPTSPSSSAVTGGNVIEQERKRIEELKRKAADEGRAQWEVERRLREANCKSFNSVESEDSSIASSCETPSEKETSLSSGDDQLEKLAELERLLAQAQVEKMKIIEEQVKRREAEMVALHEERQKREILERRLQEETQLREELINQEIKLREKQKQQARPLTRYLPIRSSEFNLRQHIESAGHHIDMCPHVIITATTCKGFLHKMGGKIKTWHKRWFVFDRVKRSLVYYTDKTETKPRGGIYFQAIEEVYVDHLKSVKSPNTKLTFCVKTYDRTYYLVAPTPETMRIWIDVIFTGAEGYQQFF